MVQLRDCRVGETIYEGPETILRRATYTPTGDSLVLKMSGSGATGARAIGRLIHEHRILVKLADVPGVVHTRGLEHEGMQAVLFLEDNGLNSLDRSLADHGPLSFNAALHVAVELSRVLQSIHAAGVVHKDVKPQNILWDKISNRVMLLDFSISSELFEEATNAAIPEALEGTLAYMSPEQTGRTARGLDARTDIYSFGVTLFELLSGRRPFVETDPLALVHAHLAKPIPNLEHVVAGIPPIVARIVERCVEKHPEKRYQTAAGLAADLEQCVLQLEKRGTLATFDLGQKDFSPILRIPQTLVSRERETAEIKAAFERAANGAVEVLLLGGPSGVGKTALVRSVYQEIAHVGRGLLLSGKHDQLGRSVPYAAIARAFGGFVRDIAASPKSVFDSWKNRIQNAIGARARVIADLVPELEWLMGEIAPLPVVPTELMYNRLKLTWIDFVRVVADVSPPLVLFLDDMQWVDPASLETLEVLLADVDRKNLLVIAAYRDNEVDAAHPLWPFINTVERSGVSISRLIVGALDDHAVAQWLGSVLDCEPTRLQALANALQSKTQGNPFFLGQLLLELHRRRLIRRNSNTGEWEWDQQAIDRVAMTENVVELMRQKVVELPENTQMLLGRAACAGHSFSLVDLSILAGDERSNIVRDLTPALIAGLLIPEDGQYRDAQALAQSADTGDLDVTYRFMHDRVQEAFYQRIDPEKRTQTHLLIGRRMQQAFEKESGSNQKLLEFVRHLNLGAAAIGTEDERKGLAQLNLRAARAAKINGSYRLQAHLVEQAQGLLGERAWQDEPETSIELALERIEADFMLRQFDDVHRRAEDLLTRKMTTVSRLAVQELRARAYQAVGQQLQAYHLGISALAEHGLVFPENEETCYRLTAQWTNECNQWLDEHPDGFSSFIFDSNPEHKLLDALEGLLAVSAMRVGALGVGVLATVGNVRQTIEKKRVTILSPYAISGFAQVQAGMSQNHRTSVHWAEQGYHIATRIKSSFLPQCSSILGIMSNYARPVEESRKYYHEAIREATNAGSFAGLGNGLTGEFCDLDLWRGHHLGDLAAREESLRNLMVRAADAAGCEIMAIGARYISCLRTTSGHARLPDAEWLEPSSFALRERGIILFAQWQRVYEAHLFLAFGEHARALARADEAHQYRSQLLGSSIVADIPVWRGIAAAKCFSNSLPETEQSLLREKLESSIARLQYLADGCAENFLHKLRLLEAEHARIHGRIADAMAKYDEAIDLARAEGFLQIEGLSAHCCAEFFLELGRKRQTAMYLHEARDAYRKWDALAVVDYLESKYSEWLRPNTNDTQSKSTLTFTTLATQSMGALALDVHTAIRAAQALSGELDPERVVGRLMELCLANAGAERGVLVFAENDSLVRVARLSVRNARIETGLSDPLAQCNDLATTVVRYVARTKEPLVLNDVLLEKRFSDDDYLAAHPIRSLLALPLTHRGRVGGVLYLEHQSAPAAFPPARVELLSVIASQAAIAVENAKLYQNIEMQLRTLETRNRDIQQLNDELRRQIAQRSRRLMDSLMSNDDEAPVRNYEPGSIIGDCYKIVKQIGEGGMGLVYEVERTTDGVHLAAKVLNHNPDRNDLGRFVREAQILAKLSHPNLISIYDIDMTDTGILYIVMELVPGFTLRRIEGHGGDARWILNVLGQIAKALEALHSLSVVHRDLKPENVLVVSPESQRMPIVKLADFGISIVTNDPQQSIAFDQYASTASADIAPQEGLAERASMLTQTGVLVGTPLYMAPELGYGSKNALPSSDIFAFGVIAYELFTQEKPYGFPPVLGGRISDDVGEKLQQRAELPATCVELILRCLETDPEKRPSAHDVALGIDNAAALVNA